MGKGKRGRENDANEISEELEQLGHRPEGIDEALRHGGNENTGFRYVREGGFDKTNSRKNSRRYWRGADGPPRSR